MSKRFKIILFVRFSGYFLFFAGLMGLTFMLGPVVQTEAGYRISRILGIKKTVPVIASFEQFAQAEATESDAGGPVDFSNVSSGGNNIIPVSTEYGVVIEKINANARIIPNVNPGDEEQYVQVLAQGVAEALGSTPPGVPGNLYLFSHSTDAPWNIIRYNAVFYLLKELEPGDGIIIFYKNRRYDYVVFDKTIASPDDISFLTNRYNAPVVTLQTCDPPGTLLNRLIVRARLVSS
ncbi:MAG: sortase [Candidatus Daviesbacteria bacterium]|nr:sortase [Candidatus Daviesbacteria bacterium]